MDLLHPGTRNAAQTSPYVTLTQGAKQFQEITALQKTIKYAKTICLCKYKCKHIQRNINTNKQSIQATDKERNPYEETKKERRNRRNAVENALTKPRQFPYFSS